jgi:hypothetical protein
MEPAIISASIIISALGVLIGAQQRVCHAGVGLDMLFPVAWRRSRADVPHLLKETEGG